MSLLEIQVADLREDVTVIQGGVVELDDDVNFLFDEQIIQDDRLLNLKETSDQVVVELAEINANILGNLILKLEISYLYFKIILIDYVQCFEFRSGH